MDDLSTLPVTQREEFFIPVSPLRIPPSSYHSLNNGNNNTNKEEDWMMVQRSTTSTAITTAPKGSSYSSRLSPSSTPSLVNTGSSLSKQSYPHNHDISSLLNGGETQPLSPGDLQTLWYNNDNISTSSTIAVPTTAVSGEETTTELGRVPLSPSKQSLANDATMIGPSIPSPSSSLTPPFQPFIREDENLPTDSNDEQLTVHHSRTTTSLLATLPSAKILPFSQHPVVSPPQDSSHVKSDSSSSSLSVPLNNVVVEQSITIPARESLIPTLSNTYEDSMRTTSPRLTTKNSSINNLLQSNEERNAVPLLPVPDHQPIESFPYRSEDEEGEEDLDHNNAALVLSQPIDMNVNDETNGVYSVVLGVASTYMSSYNNHHQPIPTDESEPLPRLSSPFIKVSQSSIQTSVSPLLISSSPSILGKHLREEPLVGKELKEGLIPDVPLREVSINNGPLSLQHASIELNTVTPLSSFIQHCPPEDLHRMVEKFRQHYTAHGNAASTISPNYFDTLTSSTTDIDAVHHLAKRLRTIYTAKELIRLFFPTVERTPEVTHHEEHAMYDITDHVPIPSAPIGITSQGPVSQTLDFSYRFDGDEDDAASTYVDPNHEASVQKESQILSVPWEHQVPLFSSVPETFCSPVIGKVKEYESISIPYDSSTANFHEPQEQDQRYNQSPVTATVSEDNGSKAINIEPNEQAVSTVTVPSENTVVPSLPITCVPANFFTTNNEDLISAILHQENNADNGLYVINSNYQGNNMDRKELGIKPIDDGWQDARLRSYATLHEPKPTIPLHRDESHQSIVPGRLPTDDKVAVPPSTSSTPNITSTDVPKSLNRLPRVGIENAKARRVTSQDVDFDNFEDEEDRKIKERIQKMGLISSIKGSIENKQLPPSQPPPPPPSIRYSHQQMQQLEQEADVLRTELVKKELLIQQQKFQLEQQQRLPPNTSNTLQPVQVPSTTTSIVKESVESPHVVNRRKRNVVVIDGWGGDISQRTIMESQESPTEQVTTTESTVTLEKKEFSSPIKSASSSISSRASIPAAERSQPSRKDIPSVRDILQRRQLQRGLSLKDKSAPHPLSSLLSISNTLASVKSLLSNAPVPNTDNVGIHNLSTFPLPVSRSLNNNSSSSSSSSSSSTTTSLSSSMSLSSSTDTSKSKQPPQISEGEESGVLRTVTSLRSTNPNIAVPLTNPKGWESVGKSSLKLDQLLYDSELPVLSNNRTTTTMCSIDSTNTSDKSSVKAKKGKISDSRLVPFSSIGLPENTSSLRSVSSLQASVSIGSSSKGDTTKTHTGLLPKSDTTKNHSIQTTLRFGK